MELYVVSLPEIYERIRHARTQPASRLLSPAAIITDS
jgi:hypothetical protein